MSHQSYWRSLARERIIQVIEQYLARRAKETDALVSPLFATKLSPQELKELKSQISLILPIWGEKILPLSNLASRGQGTNSNA